MLDLENKICSEIDFLPWRRGLEEIPFWPCLEVALAGD